MCNALASYQGIRGLPLFCATACASHIPPNVASTIPALGPIPISQDSLQASTLGLSLRRRRSALEAASTQDSGPNREQGRLADWPPPEPEAHNAGVQQGSSSPQAAPENASRHLRHALRPGLEEGKGAASDCASLLSVSHFGSWLSWLQGALDPVALRHRLSAILSFLVWDPQRSYAMRWPSPRHHTRCPQIACNRGERLCLAISLARGMTRRWQRHSFVCDG